MYYYAQHRIRGLAVANPPSMVGLTLVGLLLKQRRVNASKMVLTWWASVHPTVLVGLRSTLVGLCSVLLSGRNLLTVKLQHESRGQKFTHGALATRKPRAEIHSRRTCSTKAEDRNSLLRQPIVITSPRPQTMVTTGGIASCAPSSIRGSTLVGGRLRRDACRTSQFWIGLLLGLRR